MAEQRERRGRDRHRPEPWTLVWVPLNGKPSRAISLGAGLRRLLSTLCVLGALGFVHTGYTLHGAYGLWSRVPQLVTALGLPAPTARFLALGRASDEPTYSALERRAARERAKHLGLGTTQTAGRLLAGQVDARWLEALDGSALREATLLWPVRDGWYVRGWGSGSDAYHLAVDIAASRGSPVQAAADGLVGYAGDAIQGYGNLVLLVHRDGIVTVYAHNQQNFVQPGERVRRGQLIAELGSTGISRGPHVHFEFLHAGKNCDPVPLFRPGVRHRPGHLGAIAPAEWRDGSARPSAVRCDVRRMHPDHDSHARAGHTTRTDESAELAVLRP